MFCVTPRAANGPEYERRIYMGHKWLSVSRIALAVIFVAVAGLSQAGADDFFKGKTITIFVGYRVGGGYDVFTRTAARHMGKYIPGNPTIVVENKTGAGSLIAANYVYTRAEPDGLTLGVFGGGLITQQALGEKAIRFDARKFDWIGSMSVGTPTCVIMGFTGLKTLDDVLHSKKELRFGSTGPGSTTDDLPKLLIGLLNAPLKVIAGYKGTSGLRVAMQRRELDGACWTWESIRTTARAMLNAKGDERLIPFLIEGAYNDPEVKHLPQFSKQIKDPHDLAAFKTWLNPYKMFRPLTAPPKTPKDRVELLRAGLKKTMESPEFLADAKKAKLDVEYTSAAQMEKYIEEILNIPPQAAEKLKKLIGRKPKKK
jgi:tripartite-type tricarboxylate transporter receptor subunit TctC